MSPMPVADPCTKRDVESCGFVGVPPKKCCAVVPPNGMICASLVPVSEVETIGRTTPMSTRSRSEEHTSELQSPCNLVCRLLLEKKKTQLQILNNLLKRGVWERHRATVQ